MCRSINILPVKWGTRELGVLETCTHRMMQIKYKILQVEEMQSSRNSF